MIKIEKVFVDNLVKTIGLTKLKDDYGYYLLHNSLIYYFDNKEEYEVTKIDINS